MEIDLSGNYRASLSRLADRLTANTFNTALLSLAGFLILAAAGLLYAESAWGWFVLGLVVIVSALGVWIKNGLSDIPASNGSSLADLLDSHLLGKLPDKPTPYDLAQALDGSIGGNFFAVRYGLTPDIIAQLSTKNPADTEAVWQVAYGMQQSIRPGKVNSATLAATLITASEQANDFLPRLALSSDDIKAGAGWYQHIRDVVDEFRKPKKTGGFARDWSFGFTPLLERFGVNLSLQISRGSIPNVEIDSHKQVLKQIEHLLTNGARHNAALIGQLGVGKMTVVNSLAEKLLHDPSAEKDLRYSQVIDLDAASLISAAPSRGQLEQLVSRILNEAYQAKNIIICLDNAQLFFEEGTGSVDLSNILLPALEAGGIRIILTMDNQRWLQISSRMPALATALNRVNVEPPTKTETIKILQTQIITIEHQSKVAYVYQALDTAYDLGDRYIQELAMPGKAIKLLEAAATFSDDGYVTQASVRQAVENMVGVKVGSADDATEKQTLLNMEDLIHKRMINQSRAVKVVSDALRRARSGVRNQNRPIGTFLFLGPTGVGKTELAKALAAVYFGGEDRLLRVDLNEYVRSEDVARLIADASTNEHSLAAQISRQPFSVVLLDEIEKAHKDVLATLLQVLDEGMLRDINGREISCRDTIFIATSNAGAQQIHEYIGAGTDLESIEKQLIDELIKNGEFRPEFLNRFDEIVVFTPLQKPELRQIIDLIIASLNKNLANQKITVILSDEAKDLLVESGYDPQLGARPMRRVVQRSVENVISRRMLEGTVTPGQQIELNREEVAASLAR